MDVIDRFIATSLAIKVFKRDQKLFEDFKMGDVYLDKTDATIDKLYEDFNNLKREMYTVHHIDIRKLQDTIYLVKSRDKNEVREYTAEQLKNMTSEVMEEYLIVDKAVPHIRKNRRWKNISPH